MEDGRLKTERRIRKEEYERKSTKKATGKNVLLKLIFRLLK
jgi:hypothetical protein